MNDNTRSRYADWSERFLLETGADGVLIMVFAGNKGTGSSESVRGTNVLETKLHLAGSLRMIAGVLESPGGTPIPTNLKPLEEEYAERLLLETYARATFVVFIYNYTDEAHWSIAGLNGGEAEFIPQLPNAFRNLALMIDKLAKDATSKWTNEPSN